MYRTVEAGKSEEWDLNMMQSRFDMDTLYKRTT